MQIIEKSSLGVRTAIYTLASRTRAPSITVFPMIHVGEPRFYINVKDRLDAYDFILFEGVKSKFSKRVTKSYRLYPDRDKNGLMVQPKLNPDHFVGELIHADIDGITFDEEWEKLPWRLRCLMEIFGPLYGIYARYFEGRHAFFENAGLDLLEDRGDTFASNELIALDNLLLKKRDKILIGHIDSLLDMHKNNPVKIAIVFGAAHMRAVLRYLVLKLDYFVQDSEWMTIVDDYE